MAESLGWYGYHPHTKKSQKADKAEPKSSMDRPNGTETPDILSYEQYGETKYATTLEHHASAPRIVDAVERAGSPGTHLAGQMG